MMRALILLMVILLPARLLLAQTYTDVQPVFATRCVGCHHTGGSAPFSLATYEEVKRRISFIKEVINTGYMPPFKADVHYRDYANNRILTPEEKNTILNWISNNAPKGKTVAPAKVVDVNATAPDLILKADKPYIVKGDNQERFVIFKVPFELKDTANIERLELYTNNKKVIHHINYGFYAVADAGKDISVAPSFVEADIDTAGLEVKRFGPLKQNMVYYSGWIPGTTEEFYPKQFGWVLPKRGVVLLTVHYAAIAADEVSTVGVKLFYKKGPVQRKVQIISLGSGGIAERDIQPRFVIFPNQVSTYTLKVKTQETQSVMYVWPHMHLLGKEFVAYAVTPDRDTIPLVHIPAWDFRWQELYRMQHLVKIPAGAIIHMIGIYDNTTGNPVNPNHPPKLVMSSGDMRANEEMFTLMMIYVPYEPGDENITL
ncbi:cytochrome c [Chitinophaga sancti]|uniref:cytochrome c n=1 Tax=Chitinophaga sancti TaxID=1004 RepID=UPI002A75882C|nr:cytochrome c [Chitinophaga sancti]WPQ64547.1 cytochrome c [Chitinophaga sancti]